MRWSPRTRTCDTLGDVTTTPPPPPPPSAPPSRAERLRQSLSGERTPLQRDPDDRVVAGVCAGVARQIGVDPLVMRVATVVFAFAGGVGIVLYLLAWTVSEERPPDAPAVPITRQQTVAVGLISLGTLLLLRDIGLWLGDTLVLPVVLGAAGSIVIWARADEDDRRRWTSLPDRFPGHSEQRSPASPVRLLAGAILIGIGVTAILATNNALLALRSVGLAIAATLVGAALVFGPWISRLVGELTEERRERIRSEERAEVAAHLHDSVLQTLALIQRSADQPRRMVALARSQERELRAWLYDQRELAAPGATLRGLLDDVLAQVEAAHELDVELVVVGDATPDEDVRALVAAVREALTNAGKHAGVATASVYVEVVDDDLVAFVRDRGAGFDADAVAGDRRGIADSIRGRLRRHGGTATLHTAPGDGTEWEFVLPLRSEPTDDPTESPL